MRILQVCTLRTMGAQEFRQLCAWHPQTRDRPTDLSPAAHLKPWPAHISAARTPRQKPAPPRGFGRVFIRVSLTTTASVRGNPTWLLPNISPKTLGASQLPPTSVNVQLKTFQLVKEGRFCVTNSSKAARKRGPWQYHPEQFR